MRITRHIVATLIIAALAFAAGRSDLLTTSAALAQQPPKEPAAGQPPAEMDAAMQAMMKFGTPGKNHEYLEPSIGTFQGTVRFKMDPAGDWMESKGTIVREWVLDKHFVHETVQASSEMGDFEAIGYIGYNNYDGLYEIAWMENMSTAIIVEAGTYDPDTKVMTFRAQHRDPATGRVVPGRGEWNLSNPDRQTMSGYAIDANGKEFKSFEGTFERVKK